MYLRLDDVFPDGITGSGIFTALQSLDVPWQDENINTELDLMYHGNHGQRIISPLLRKMLNSDNELTTENTGKLASAIFNIYNLKWTKLYNTLSLEYNPISNYDMEEHETPAEITRTITPAETTETITPAETTETIKPPETSVDIKPAKTITENQVSAFNSSDYVDDIKSIVAGDSTDKGSEKLTVDVSGTNELDVDTAGSNKLEVDTAGSEVITVQNERTLTRSGNIGVTTSQQMIQSERDLWQWNFFESVFNDLDDVLTLSIY